jgi:hypothetical protein
MTRSTTETTLFWDYYRRRDDENELDGAPRHNQPRQPAPGLQDPTPDMVNRPEHYRRGPKIGDRTLEAIEVVRYIRDSRLANAQRYLWRIAFGGKLDSAEDAQKLIWYINDWLEHPVAED